MASAATLLRVRGYPFLQARALRTALPSRYSVGISWLEPQLTLDPVGSWREFNGRTEAVGVGGLEGLTPPSPPKQKDNSWEDHPDYRQWKDKEEEILQDIEPVRFLIKDILHSDRYMDGERLSTEDEKEVIEKLLAYHPHSVDKIGCGLDSIMALFGVGSLWCEREFCCGWSFSSDGKGSPTLEEVCNRNRSDCLRAFL